VEVTTADKIQALGQTFLNPQLYISMGAIIIVLAVSARMKNAGVRAGSRAGRFGLVVHWASLLIAAIPFGLGGLILANAKTVNDNTILFVGLWWAAAIEIRLIGKAVRFILTGPLPPSEQTARSPIPPSQHYQAQQRALSGPTGPKTGA
jgi:hypothetical protein